MIVLRIWEGILSIAEIIGIFYILIMFSEKREMESWSAALFCDGSMPSAYLSENYERFVFPLFYADLHRYFLCYSLAVF